MAADKSLLLSLRNVYETFAISAPTIVDALRGTLSREVCDGRMDSWGANVVANAGMVLDVHGRENIPPAGTTHLVMSNHQSHYDIAVLYRVLGGAMRMVAKRELFSIPVFGQALKIGGFISVDRGNRESAIASLEDAKASLAAGVPIWIAPEGTRSPTGELMPFKRGAFVIALDTGAPVLPITIQGTRNALPAKGLRSKRGVPVRVTIHPTIDPAPFAARHPDDPKAARSELADAVRDVIASAL